MESKKHAYKPVSSFDDLSSSATDVDERSNDDYALESLHTRTRSWRWIKNPLLASIISLNVLVAALIVVALTRKPTDQQCSTQLSTYSPLLDSIEYIEYDFAAEFNSTNKYRGPPTPEREDAWYNLTYKHAVEIPADKIAELNRTEADNLKRVPEDVGTGYVAIIEVFHQLHCLNMIRMFTWYQAGKYPGIPDGLSDNELKNRMHVDHCLDALRIAIQCYGDVTPLFVRNGGHAGAKADFDTHHKCRNFDKIEAWIDENWTVS